MKFAFPRQRETYIMKKKVLGPDQLHASVDYLTLKRESLRIDSSELAQHSLMMLGLESSIQSKENVQGTRNVNVVDGR